MTDWTTEDSRELYAVDRWGADFFDVNESGHIVVRPGGEGTSGVDLMCLVDELRDRDLRTPLLVRFSDILASRIEALGAAFDHAIEDNGYRGSYRTVYPIKVNQQRHVIEEIIQFGATRGVGLEAGSKPELLAALAMLDTPDAPLICNGYKDHAYIETALLAQSLGRRTIVVVDRFRELEIIVKTSHQLGIRPSIGFRGRLASRGAGRWADSSGTRSKFGLSASQLVAGADYLRSEGMLDCLELLHFHIGSQISAIRAHKEALSEAARIYVGLREIGAEHLATIDVGGGLGVDYDGSGSDFHSSMNYSLPEYASDIIATIQEACDGANQPHPDLITESGRALVAHHSVLIFDVLGVDESNGNQPTEPVLPEDPKILHDFADVLDTLASGSLQEAYHDAIETREQAGALFALGYLDLRTRGRAEHLFSQCCERIREAVQELDQVPEELADLVANLADTYYGNLSVFQSAPDHWAIGQLFPVVPIHRLDERPTRRGVFADLTCDSDGRISEFIARRGSKRSLELHAMDGRPYYVGVFLVGAYQEILGDLHNLFGDTDAVHVRLDDAGKVIIENVVEGDSVGDVLGYVQYDVKALIEKVRKLSESALSSGRISVQESARLRRHFELGLRSYTYLSES